jgi:hypothetical protein
MTRQQAIEQAGTLRRGKTICNVLREDGQRYAASMEDFDSVNLAKKEVRRKIADGFKGCVVLKRDESFPPAKHELQKAA